MPTIKQMALSVGFDACGIARAEALTEDALFLQKWLGEGNQGDMHYLERNFDKRSDPRILVPGSKSVVVVLMNYFPKEHQNPEAPQIAKYSYSATDYHLVLKEKLASLEQKICEKYGAESINANHQHLFVDSAPILERRWAQRAGLGWIGKHTQLIHPGLGSYTFIGILLLNIETEYDVPLISRCGSCTRCMDACPTHALSNGSMDARKCISYLTIESKGKTPSYLQPLLSGNAVGCDICADACPWNAKWAIPHSHNELSPSEMIEKSLTNKTVSMLEWDYERWLQLTEEEFNSTFKHSAIRRAGFAKLRKNIEELAKIRQYL